MAATLATVDAILKEVYEPSIREQLNDDVVALRRIERSSEGVTSQVGGKYVVFPIHTTRNSGIGARLENDDLPPAGNQGYERAQVNLRYLYGRIQLTGQTIELADSNFQAFASAMSEEVSGVKTDLAKDLNRQVYGNGTGVVATVVSGALASFVVDNIQWLQIGMMIGTGTQAGTGVVTSVCTGAVITNIDVATKTVTTSGGTGTLAAGHVVYRGVSATMNNAQLAAGDKNQKEWTGLAGLVGTDPLFGIDPASTPLWQSWIDENGGSNRALSEGLIVLNVDKVRAAGSKTTVMFMNLGVRRAYFNLLVQQRRYTNTQTFEGGFSGLAFTTDAGEVPMVVDTDAPYNTIYGLNEKEIKVYRDQDWTFMNRDGSNWSRVPNKDAYEATLFQYSELGTHRRNAQFRIEDITEA